jgi:hypothetical protein
MESIQKSYCELAKARIFTQRWFINWRSHPLNQAIIRLQSFNFPLQMSESRPALFTRDPDGNIIEINQQ